MTRYVAHRLLSLVPVAIGVTLVVFSLLHLTGDPIRLLFGLNVPEEIVQQRRDELGLNRPVAVQYARWLTRAVRGDLGESITTGDRVVAMIRPRLGPTLELTLLALLVTLVVSLPAGVISAVRRNTVLDSLSRLTALFWVSMPTFWLGLLFILVFGVMLGWLPISGRAEEFWSWEGVRSHILPVLTLGLPPAALFTRLTRSSMLEVIGEEYVRTAHSKGLAERTVIVKHALRNALIPILTLIGLRLPWLFGGAVITETVFAWPGMGRLLVDAVLKRDYPVVQGIVMAMALLVVASSLLIDLLYAYVDPRIRYQ
ncbi:MAG: ABC transporter permease [Armatimonadota bacterium]|nr:ABC transporter permease [Armatimonadota bacterium]